MCNLRFPWRCGWCEGFHLSGERRWSSWGWLCKGCIANPRWATATSTCITTGDSTEGEGGSSE